MSVALVTAKSRSLKALALGSTATAVLVIAASSGAMARQHDQCDDRYRYQCDQQCAAVGRNTAKFSGWRARRGERGDKHRLQHR